MSFLSANLAFNALGILSPKNVAIYNGTKEVLTGNMLFGTSIMNCNVVEDSALMEHPVESGFKIADSKVFNPVEIDIRLSMPAYFYNSVFSELKALYDESPKLRIKTKNRYYHNMVLQAIPHEETPENFDRLVFDLHFKEVREVAPQYIKLQSSNLKNPENSDTIKTGDNLTNTQKKKSILRVGTDTIKGWL